MLAYLGKIQKFKIDCIKSDKPAPNDPFGFLTRQEIFTIENDNRSNNMQYAENEELLSQRSPVLDKILK